MIQSTNSSVLMKFKEITNYELVYMVDETIRDAENSTIEDIKQFASSVSINKASIFPENLAFLTGITSVVPKLHSFKLNVYVQLFSNEFVSQAWDFFSDPTVEINTFVMGAEIDGIITDFPGTATAYRKNRCLKLGDNIPSYMNPVQPGGLMQVITPQYLPPAEAPYPVLTEDDVAEAPLPPISKTSPNSNTGGSVAAPTSPSQQPRITACVFLSTLTTLLAFLLLF
ncbi:hypothetical protein HHK36_032709 [Tetracentron sinense]|uniref:glycerophosphodiester phosphodiesterase n=1 Tax=Tetracentron sinense TaxID=13715 RepID=A0A835CWT5_TETSI|nr:hypothetical protein HHK36_032709 [Tetracentron sinense]